MFFNPRPHSGATSWRPCLQRLPLIQRPTAFMKSAGSAALALALAFQALPATAEPTTGPVSVVNIRPYMGPGPGTVYFTIDRTDLCGTNTYAIDLTWGGSKQAVATLMLAFAGQHRIMVEIDNAGCANPSWGTKVQSVYIVR